jgi:16S rRNA (guanine527-N7)-methyltransferase
MSVAQQNRDAFVQAAAVTPDALTAFDAYADLLARWQARINLVGPKTLETLWHRHFLDSAQLFTHLPSDTQTLTDIGSGGGFPGLVLAIMAAHQGGPAVTLVESDARKAAFLREASRVCGAGATIINARAEAVEAPAADVVTARACAPLPRLLPWVFSRLRADGTALLLKGANWRDELTAAEKGWTLTSAKIPSCTDTSGVILKLEGLNPN